MTYGPAAAPVQVAATLQYAHANDVTPFMEPVLELCLAVLTRERREAVAVTLDPPHRGRKCVPHSKGYRGWSSVKSLDSRPCKTIHESPKTRQPSSGVEVYVLLARNTHASSPHTAPTASAGSTDDAAPIPRPSVLLISYQPGPVL